MRGALPLLGLLALGCVEEADDTGLDAPTGRCEPEGEPRALQVFPVDGDLGAIGVVADEESWLVLVEVGFGGSSTLQRWRSDDDGRSWRGPELVTAVPGRAERSPSSVQVDGDAWVYLHTVEGEAGTWWRAGLSDGEVGLATPVFTPRGAGGGELPLSAWTDGGAVWIGAQSSGRRPLTAVALDGISFAETSSPTSDPVQQYQAFTLGDGRIGAFWITDDSQLFTSDSEDGGASWSPAVNGTSQFDQTTWAEALFVERGRVDLYYVTPEGVLARRPLLSEPGSRPEQALFGGGGRPVRRVSARRTSDCRVLLGMTLDDTDGPAVGIQVLDSDAPAR